MPMDDANTIKSILGVPDGECMRETVSSPGTAASVKKSQQQPNNAEGDTYEVEKDFVEAIGSDGQIIRKLRSVSFQSDDSYEAPIEDPLAGAIDLSAARPSVYESIN